MPLEQLYLKKITVITRWLFIKISIHPYLKKSLKNTAKFGRS